MSHWNLRHMRAALKERGIRMEPHAASNGKQLYKVWPNGAAYLAEYSDDMDEAYIIGLRMTIPAHVINDTGVKNPNGNWA